MNDYKKIGVLGGDARMVEVCRVLSGASLEVAAWGFDSHPLPGDCVRVRDISDAIKNSVALILPLPVSRDSLTLNCPLYRGDAPKLSAVFDMAEAGVHIFGGNFSPSVKSELERRETKYTDYSELEEFAIKNAIPSAEGAVEIAMRELPITLHGAKCAVVGYGRIGKILSRDLAALGAAVSVAARKSYDLAWAASLGYTPVQISDFWNACEKYDVIFNTAPARLFTKERLARLRENALIIDLASAPGGVDPEAAKMLGIRVIHAPGLPGKCAPVTAGTIIGECMRDLIKKGGIAP